MVMSLKRDGWPILIILVFVLLSYLIIFSDYNHAQGDAGVYAKCAQVLYEKNRIDITYSAASLIGQLLFSHIFCHIFGFSFKILNISVYVVNFLLLIGMYLLLSELGLNRFLALFGSLTLFVNPVSLQMIDWYMTEPFFMFYLVFSILFFVKGLKGEKHRFLYIGGIFCILAVLTRQYAVSISMAMILLLIVYRKELKKKTISHCLASSALPVLALGLFYLFLFQYKKIQMNVPYSYAISGNLDIIKGFANPLNLLLRLFLDALICLHYSALYISPLLIIIILSLLMDPKKIRNLSSGFPLLMISILFVSMGTLVLYLKNNRLMPYIPSIFSISSLTRVFTFTIMKPSTASLILTLFTSVGATIILVKILEFFFYKNVNRNPLSKPDKRNHKIKEIKRKDTQPDLQRAFFYIWGISYILLSVLIGLVYERYIFPVSVLMIYILLSHFRWIGEQKKIFIMIFVLFYSMFIFQVASSRLKIDLQWEANQFLLNEGIPCYRINGGLGFNQFYSFDQITDTYKNVKINRPVNWYKYHPQAEYFVTSNAGLEKRCASLVLYRTLTGKRLFGLIEGRSYIYKRRNGSKELIWI